MKIPLYPPFPKGDVIVPPLAKGGWGDLDFKMKKGIYILPNLITLSSMFAGFYSIVASFNSEYELAAWAIMVAAIFDVLDGWVARLTHTATRFGIEIGSVGKQDDVRPMWRNLLTNHAALVAGLQARRVMAPDKKWRLIAGPFSSAAEAMQACGLFKKADMPCEATVFAGDAF